MFNICYLQICYWKGGEKARLAGEALQSFWMRSLVHQKLNQCNRLTQCAQHWLACSSSTIFSALAYITVTHTSSPSNAPTQQQLMKRGEALASKIARLPCLSGFLASIYPHQRHSYIWWLQILSAPKPLFHSIMLPVPSEWQWEFPLYPMKSYVVNQKSESLSETNL